MTKDGKKNYNVMNMQNSKVLQFTLLIKSFCFNLPQNVLKYIQSERKAMVGKPKSYHKTPKTSYLEEGFSNIQNTAMVLISRDQINEV